MSSIAFFASPIDFQKNEKLDHKIKKENQNKLNMDMLKQLTIDPKTELTGDINNIHNNLDDNIREDNVNTLADYYSEESKEDIKKQVAQTEYSQDLYHNDTVVKDYLISNNQNMNSVYKDGGGGASRDELLDKLNYIINLFEDEKEMKTGKKNEEVVLYCFLGIFIIYVLDSFVSIGKYKR